MAVREALEIGRVKEDTKATCNFCQLAHSKIDSSMRIPYMIVKEGEFLYDSS